MLRAVTGRSPSKSESTIDALREQTLRMGALAEAILAKALRCVVERDRALGEAVQRDDLAIDQLDVAIDDGRVNVRLLGGDRRSCEKAKNS